MISQHIWNAKFIHLWHAACIPWYAFKMIFLLPPFVYWYTFSINTLFWYIRICSANFYKGVFCMDILYIVKCSSFWHSIQNGLNLVFVSIEFIRLMKIFTQSASWPIESISWNVSHFVCLFVQSPAFLWVCQSHQIFL